MHSAAHPLAIVPTTTTATEAVSPVRPVPVMTTLGSPPLTVQSISLSSTSNTSSSTATASFPLATMPQDELRRLAQEHMARLTSGADDSSSQQQPIDTDQRVMAEAAAQYPQQQSYPQAPHPQQQQNIPTGFSQYPPQQYQQQQQQYYGHNVAPAAAPSNAAQAFMSPQGSMYQGPPVYHGHG
ncbi:MAG: hypothetical protein ACQPRI_06265, partial [Solitalea-like symbiont of Tyrophagus putrescentiae]